MKSLLKLILFFLPSGGKEVHYINGAQTLPHPLTAEQEAKLLSRMDEDAVRDILVEHNLRLVVYIAKKFESSATGIEDLISIGTIGLMKAIDTFRPDKNIKLATYASRCIENEILMYMRKNSTKRVELSIDEPLNIDRDGNELLLLDVIGSDEDSVSADIEREEDQKTIKQAIAHLSCREREIITLRFGLEGQKEHTQKEVADLLGISQSYISRLEKKIILHLKEDIGTKI